MESNENSGYSHHLSNPFLLSSPKAKVRIYTEIYRIMVYLMIPSHLKPLY